MAGYTGGGTERRDVAAPADREDSLPRQTFAWLLAITVVSAPPALAQVTTAPPLSWRGAVPDSLLPRYPEILKSANVHGTVEGDLLVLPSGAVVRGSFRAPSSTHELFTSSVRSAVARWRFAPWSSDSAAPPLRVPLVVEFILPASDTIPGIPLREDLSDAGGIHFRLGAQPIERDPRMVADSAAMLGILAMVVEQNAPRRTRAVQVFCARWIAGKDAPLPQAVVARLDSSFARPVPMSKCPRTYTSMIAHVGAEGGADRPPAGYEDPWRLSVWIEPWASGAYAVRIAMARGTGESSVRCTAVRESAASPWTLTCGSSRFTVF